MLVVVSILVGAFNSSAFAQAGHPPEGDHGMKSHLGSTHHGKDKHDPFCWMSTLTEEQQSKFAKLRLEYKKVKYHLKAQIRVRKVELVSLVTRDTPDQNAINTKIEEILDLKRKLIQKKYAFKVSLRSMLNPEQRVAFDMKMLRMAYHGKKHGHKIGHAYQ